VPCGATSCAGSGLAWIGFTGVVIEDAETNHSMACLPARETRARARSRLGRSHRAHRGPTPATRRGRPRAHGTRGPT